MSIKNLNCDQDIGENDFIFAISARTSKPIPIPLIVRPVRRETRIINNISLFIIVSILYFPISVLNFYFAKNDDSCVQQDFGDYFKLYHYFIVDGVYGLSLVAILFVVLFVVKLDYSGDDASFHLFTAVRCIVTLILTSVGAYIFWGLMNNSLCNHKIYYYTNISLIIRFIFGIMFIKHK